MNKYLISLEVPYNLTEQIRLIKNYQSPSSGFHITLCCFYADISFEDKIVEVFKDVEFKPLFLNLENYDNFDNSKKVITLKKQEDISKLHCQIFRSLSDKGIHINQQYCLEKYNPHITIGKSNAGSNFFILNKHYIFDKFSLKKFSNKWVFLEINNLNS